jgi:hypothetical protein
MAANVHLTKYMRRLALILLAALLATLPISAQRFSKCNSCARDGRGKIARSVRAKKEFMRRSGFPKGRRGFQVDHVVALACGGRDVSQNMQWLTVAQHGVKTKVDARCVRR